MTSPLTCACAAARISGPARMYSSNRSSKVFISFVWTSAMRPGGAGSDPGPVRRLTLADVDHLRLDGPTGRRGSGRCDGPEGERARARWPSTSAVPGTQRNGTGKLSVLTESTPSDSSFATAQSTARSTARAAGDAPSDAVTELEGVGPERRVSLGPLPQRRAGIRGPRRCGERGTDQQQARGPRGFVRRAWTAEPATAPPVTQQTSSSGPRIARLRRPGAPGRAPRSGTPGRSDARAPAARPPLRGSP